MKKTVNSHLPLFAEATAELIAKWRAEMSDKSSFQPKLGAKEIKKYLQSAERYGVPAALVVHTVLACEWVFRARYLTEEDIEKELYEMEAGLCSDINPVLSRFQAHLLISVLESELKKKIQEQELLIPLVFEPTEAGPHELRALFPSQRPSEPKRTPPKRLLPPKTGRLPMPGPRVASVIVEAFLEEKMKRGSRKMGVELCSLLLKRDVQPGEFATWRKDISALPAPRREPPAKNLRAWLKEQMWRAYEQNFLMPNIAISPESFIERCKTDPAHSFFWLRREEVFKQIFSIKWGGVKNVRKTGNTKR